MAIYLSMQRARFSSAAGYEKFKNIFADVRHHLKTRPDSCISHFGSIPKIRAGTTRSASGLAKKPSRAGT
jgi:hypothetical protein